MEVKTNQIREEDEAHEELIKSLPQANAYDGSPIYLYDGVWYRATVLKPVISFANHFKARDDDVFLVSFPKCGTTWLMALITAVVHRHKQPLSQSPVLSANPHDLVPLIEYDFYYEGQDPTVLDDEDRFPSPRILGTHAPLASLPASVLSSPCRIVYCCRNPIDQFVSHCCFLQKLVSSDLKLGNTMDNIEEAFELFLKGIQPYGPFWDHMLCFWELSLKNPEKVLFLTYEELKKDINGSLKKLAEFLLLPFSDDEIKRGVMEEIAKLCSFQSLKNLEANKVGTVNNFVPSNSFFRKGEIGDWVNHITPAMASRFDELLKEKFGGTGLEFDVFGKKG